MKAVVVLLALSLLGCKKEKEAPVRYTTELQKAKEKAEHSKNVADQAILKAAISSFYSREQRYPANLQELVSEGFLQSVPSGWEYDPTTGEIK